MLAKSAKVIPVMLMGKLVSHTKYKHYEYATAVLISVGMTAFLLDSSEGNKKGTLSFRYDYRPAGGFLLWAASRSLSRHFY